MNLLQIEATDETPRVILSLEKSLFEFEGNSYPENSTKFFTPILNWFREVIDGGVKTDMTVSFSFDYFNTSSAKYILEILRLIQEFQAKGNTCLVQWYFMDDDTDMQEAGEDYRDTVTVPFEIISKES